MDISKKVILSQDKSVIIFVDHIKDIYIFKCSDEDNSSGPCFTLNASVGRFNQTIGEFSSEEFAKKVLERIFDFVADETVLRFRVPQDENGEDSK